MKIWGIYFFSPTFRRMGQVLSRYSHNTHYTRLFSPIRRGKFCYPRMFYAHWHADNSWLTSEKKAYGSLYLVYLYWVGLTKVDNANIIWIHIYAGTDISVIIYNVDKTWWILQWWYWWICLYHWYKFNEQNYVFFLLFRVSKKIWSMETSGNYSYKIDQRKVLSTFSPILNLVMNLVYVI